MQYLSIKISDFLIKTGVEIDDKELFEYGIRAILRNATIFVISFIISLFLNFTLSFLIFNTVFVALRQLTGGYHAKSSVACLIESMILILLVPYLINQINSPVPYNLLFSVLISCFLYKFAYKTNRRVVLLFTMVFLNIIIFMFNDKYYLISGYISIAMLIDLVFLILPIIQKTEKQ